MNRLFENIVFVHIPHYEANRTVDPDVLRATVESIMDKGLRRGPANPVLARTVSDAEEIGMVLPDYPHVLFVDTPERRVGIDYSFGSHVPPEKILAVVCPKKGESLREAFNRVRSEPEKCW